MKLTNDTKIYRRHFFSSGISIILVRIRKHLHPGENLHQTYTCSTILFVTDSLGYVVIEFSLFFSIPLCTGQIAQQYSVCMPVSWFTKTLTIKYCDILSRGMPHKILHKISLGIRKHWRKWCCNVNYSWLHFLGLMIATLLWIFLTQFIWILSTVFCLIFHTLWFFITSETYLNLALR